jgi:hypothetical protein
MVSRAQKLPNLVVTTTYYQMLEIFNTFTSVAEQQTIYYAWLHVFLTESYS